MNFSINYFIRNPKLSVIWRNYNKNLLYTSFFFNYNKQKLFNTNSHRFLNTHNEQKIENIVNGFGKIKSMSNVEVNNCSSTSMSNNHSQKDQFKTLNAVTIPESKNNSLSINNYLHNDMKAEEYFEVEGVHTQPHPIWNKDDLDGTKVTHVYPEQLPDTLAYYTVKGMRCCFDVLTGYVNSNFMNERTWLNRIIFLETVAGVPGMVGAFIRHLRSLRRMDRDYHWIHTLLEEAENERMHLMTALVIKRPSNIMKYAVKITQIIFTPFFALAYCLSPRYAHRFVGYLEEEAVVTYTKLAAEIDKGNLPLFQNMPAPNVAKMYWHLSENALFRDVVLALRADESHHRDVNHHFADIPKDFRNPFPPGH